MTYTAGSLFSGIGGLDLAFSWAGFDILFQVEIDAYCRKVLSKNRAYWPNAKQYEDIRNVTKTKLGYVDVLFGGFPCQDISIAGKQSGVAIGTRSGLWFEFLRLIREIRPRVVVLENVANIANVGGTIVTASLASAGYDALWLPLRAADIGAPHQRERWFCVAYRQRRRYSEQRTASKPAYHTKRNAKNGQRVQVKRQTIANRKALRVRARPGFCKSSQGMGHTPRKRQQKGRKPHTEQTKRIGITGKGRRRGSSGKFTIANRRQRCQSRNGLKSRLGGAFDGLSRRLDRHHGQWPARPNEAQYDFEPPRVTGKKENRAARIKALGNAVVPQQAYPIALAVKMFLDRQ